MEALVIDTETRHLPPQDAAMLIRSIASEARRFTPWLVYKKTDSTLRGNIAAEIGALLQVWPSRPVIFAGAYPAMGRTVTEGRLFVYGVPVQESAFAADCLNPVRNSDLRELLGGIPAAVPDCETDAELMAIARSIISGDTIPVAAGPAALAEALARCLTMPRVQRCLVVNGSRHPASAAQIEFAIKGGCFQNGWVLFAEEAAGEGIERAINTGERVRRILTDGAFEALIVFGGDTAFGIHHALGSQLFEPIGEVLPGVPICRSGGFFWITKAGGFGSAETLCNIKGQLQ